MKLDFYKDNESRWWIDLPDYDGPKSELEMVEGADYLCDVFADGSDRLSMEIGDVEFTGATGAFDLVRVCEPGAGAWYRLSMPGNVIDFWLCDVTLFVLGYFPVMIFYKNLNNEC